MSLVDLSYDDAKTYLVELKKRGVRLGLERMRRFARALGNPEKNVPCVHIAGTNGKGSVAAMLDAILHAAGWRAGLYTSPHLVKLGERIQVNRRNLAEQEIVDYTNELRSVAMQRPSGNDEQPSYFEFMTAMAFLQFARSRCDIAIIETGLGGRLDATNVVVPEVSVISSIGLDHCELLGNTLEQIAQEKAGIIKPGVPVVIGRMPAVAECVIRAVAEQQRSPVFSVAEEFGDRIGNYPHTNLAGDYQRFNAATATLAARLLPGTWNIKEGLVCDALSQVVWRGRWQRVEIGGRLLVLDASHNADGALALDANLAQLVAQTGRAPVVIAGVLGAARARPLIETICRQAREIHFVVPNQCRACSHAQLEALVPAGFRGKVLPTTVEDLFPARGVCAAGRPGDAVVVTGSIYVLGEVMVRVDPGCGPLEDSLQDF